MSARISPDWLVADQSNLTQFYAPKISLSSGENRRSLSCSYQKLFKLQWSLFYFETDSSSSIPGTNTSNLGTSASTGFKGEKQLTSLLLKYRSTKKYREVPRNTK